MNEIFTVRRTSDPLVSGVISKWIKDGYRLYWQNEPERLIAKGWQYALDNENRIVKCDTLFLMAKKITTDPSPVIPTSVPEVISNHDEDAIVVTHDESELPHRRGKKNRE